MFRKKQRVDQAVATSTNVIIALSQRSRNIFQSILDPKEVVSYTRVLESLKPRQKMGERPREATASAVGASDY